MYTVIIGHRRLNAAKLAGLTSVPCVVSDMDELQQRRTMLMENMQRNELTPYEQAKGFQMIMDLGGTLDEIVRDTGFSETTVKSRLEWAKLDDEEFKKLEGKQISITELNSLSKIEDMKLRNEALSYLGTANFNYRFSEILSKDKWNRKKAGIIEMLQSFAMEAGNDMDLRDYSFVSSFSQYNDGSKYKVPDDAKTKQYVYKIAPSGSVELYRWFDRTESERRIAEQQALVAKQKELQDRILAINETMFKLRFEFVKNYEPKAEDAMLIWPFVVKAMRNLAGYYDHNLRVYSELIDEPSLADATIRSLDNPGVMEVINKQLKKNPLKTMFQLAYNFSDSPSNSFIMMGWRSNLRKLVPVQKDNQRLSALYNPLLKTLGYEISDEEAKLMWGEHEIYFKEGDVLDE